MKLKSKKQKESLENKTSEPQTPEIKTAWTMLQEEIKKNGNS